MNQKGKTYIIQLNNEIFHIPKYFKRIGEVSENIYTELTEKGSYQVQSSVQSAILQSFLDYWQNNTLPNVNSSNFWQYHLLSQEFGMMSTYLESPEFSQISKLEYLRNVTPSDTNIDRSNSEKKISENLDYYLTNFEDELFSLPITSLTNIFNYDSRSLSNINEVYEIIKRRSINRPELFVLFETLKMSDLSDASAADAFIHMKERFGFIPQITSDLVEKHMNLKKELKKTKEELEFLQKFISEKDELNRQFLQLKGEKTIVKDGEQSSYSYKTKRTEINDVLFVVDSLNLRGNDLKAAVENVEDRAFDMVLKNRRGLFKYALIFYKNKVEFPDDYPRIFDFDDEIENLTGFGEDFIENHKDTDVGDSTCDFVSSFYHALNDLSWRDGKKSILWFAGGPAYGEFFGGKSGFDEEESKLKNFVERIASENFAFTGIYMNEQAEQTFKKMKEIYDANNGVYFSIIKFDADNYSDNYASFPHSDPLMDGDFRYAIGHPNFRKPCKK